MPRPYVTVHSMLSVDGRLDHFAGDVGLYYELVGEIPHDAVLTGSSTMLASAAGEGIDAAVEDRPDPSVAPATPPDDCPLLVIVDSAGRLRRFDWLRGVPYWRGLLVACAASTPPEHRELLTRHGIPSVETGGERVDLPALLEILAAEHGVSRLRVDSGGTLNGTLLRAGLVDEISLVLAPYAVGGRSPAGLFVAEDLVGDVVRLEPIAVDRRRGGAIWLRYRVATG